MTETVHTSETVTLARLPSGVPLTTTVHSYRPAGTDTDGGEATEITDRGAPTLYVQAAQHGREVNGTETLRRFHERLLEEPLSGTIVAVPVANPLTFDRVSYTAPEAFDSVNSNMNRVWPGDADGSLHQRMAATLWEYATQADAIVDLHTGSPDMYPHVVYREGDDRARDLATAFGTDLLLSEEANDDASEEWHRRGFAGKLRVAAAEEDIPAITPELAHSKQIVESAVETGVDGLFNVCRTLELLPGDVIDHDQTVARNHLGKVTTPESGLFRPEPALEVGELISAGTTLGTVFDPATYEPLATATAERAGVLYALTKEATVVEGETLASVALVRESEN
ncbi:succinylglutamate desuccinylase/aspartoacylase [Natrialba hulunbeirensis JCM 10989]|uniref:Succinylglutamate desuccinylase/aspartoacylase n=1 Tax=Natrialba hulunbeirensis JCM 10989 TaxID=1227493 RepID=L9ZTU4_9EURY|nr:succinylglutamate desuccinylase/aspartoacylase family protein [Natrialba hulunbeirensis]ELY89486.1 succinylglutamate desuccinylase/aspartoacylase [Natrialba hulunbeirensis JCM 10989]